jgi:hypothetical protein
MNEPLEHETKRVWEKIFASSYDFGIRPEWTQSSTLFYKGTVWPDTIVVVIS